MLVTLLLGLSCLLHHRFFVVGGKIAEHSLDLDTRITNDVVQLEATVDNDKCLMQSPGWSNRSCSTNKQWCEKWAKDMQRCCPATCGTPALSEAQCKASKSQGSCIYKHVTNVPTPALANNTAGIVLLTTSFIPKLWNEHIDEVYAALVRNLLNQYLSAVHILTEDDCDAVKHELVKWANVMPEKDEMLRQMETKLSCVATLLRRQPTYGDFFRYANKFPSGTVVLFANGDIAFDDTLGLIDQGMVSRQEQAYVLSVQSPPHDGAYKEAFNKECDLTTQCAVGAWKNSWGDQSCAGCSWDAYIFSPPLASQMNLGHLDDVIMNIQGAENLAAFQLEKGANITLSNPCYHVHAFHWHCLGDKMHSTDPMVRVDHPAWYMQKIGGPPHTVDAVSDIFPCWNCPGILMPPDAVSTPGYCQHGTMLYSSQIDALRLNFHLRSDFINSGLCCNDSSQCGSLSVERLKHCVKASDVDCVTWEANRSHTYY